MPFRMTHWLRTRLGQHSNARPRRVRQKLAVESLEERSLLSLGVIGGFAIGGDGFVPEAAASDLQGNIYVTGAFAGRYGPLTSAGAGTADVFVAKYAPSGTLLWAQRFGDVGSDVGQGIAVDGAGSVYVTGLYTGRFDADPEHPGQRVITAFDRIDAFVLKLDSNGHFGYIQTTVGSAGAQPSINRGFGIAVDANGEAAIAGAFQSTTQFGTTTMTATSSQEPFIARLDRFGNFVWARRFAGAGVSPNQAKAVSIDRNGNVFVAGSFSGPLTFKPGDSSSTVQSAGYLSAFAAKLNPAGEFLWARKFGGSTFGEATGVGADGAGNVFVAGRYGGGMILGPSQIVSPAGVGLFVTRLDGNGNPLFARDLGVAHAGPVAGDVSLAIDPTGSAVVASTSVDGSNIDVIVARVDPGGRVVSKLAMGGAGGDTVAGVAAGPDGGIVVVGSFTATAGFGPLTLTPSGASSAFVVRLSPAAFRSTPGDFDGDGMTDYSVFRVNQGRWLSALSNGGGLSVVFGAKNLKDIPVSGDFDGDGRADLVVFRPVQGRWIGSLSSGATLNARFGARNLSNIPAAADYDGDGRTDLVMFRPRDARWFGPLSGGGTLNVVFGGRNLSEIPVPGDYDGDGRADFVLFRKSDGRWVGNLTRGGTLNVPFGLPNLADVPAPGDYDGDGKVDLAVYRIAEGRFVGKLSGGTSMNVAFGQTRLADVPTTTSSGSLAALRRIPISIKKPRRRR